MDINNGLAGGGITGAIVASLYLAYKCCYRKKFKSSCCGAEMNIEADAAAQVEVEVPPVQSRQATPVIAATKPTTEPPPLTL
jgi:hypothetical protein